MHTYCFSGSMLRWAIYSVAFSMIFLCRSQDGTAQVVPNAEPLRPIINALGPSATVKAIAFSNDSTRMYVGGDDKVVHVYELGWALDPRKAQQPNLTYVDTIRWEITRGVRGQVGALAVSPQRNEIAVGGNSLRTPGDISLADLLSNEVFTALPTPVAGSTVGIKERHRKAVVSMDYSLSGSRLISSDIHEGIMVWSRDVQGKWQGQEIRAPLGFASSPLPVAFATETTFLTGLREPIRGRLQLAELNLRGEVVRRFGVELGSVMQSLACTRDGKCVVADEAGKVTVISLVGKFQSWTLQPVNKDNVVVSLSNDGVLAISSSSEQGQISSAVELWDLSARQRIDAVQVSTQRVSFTARISPDGSFLAACDEDDHALVVYGLRDATGNSISKPLSGAKPVRVTGAAREISAVATSEDERFVRISQSTKPALGSVPFNLQLDLDEGQLVPATSPQKPAVSSIAPEWRIATNGDGSNEVVVYRGNLVFARIPIDPVLQGGVTCATFLPSETNTQLPSAIAIGTYDVNGVFVYSLPVAGNERPRLLRWFYDHSSPVTSLTVVASRKLLVSAAMDGVLKIWDIQDLDSVNPAFPTSSIWGASFVTRGNRVVVEKIHPNGVAYSKGFRDGDTVQAIKALDPALGGQERAVSVDVDGPAAVVGMLGRVSPFTETRFLATQLGQNRQFLVRAGWEPLLTAFLDRQGDWVIWHPAGYFNASLAEGGNLFGWQRNLGLGQAPQVVFGDQLQKDFERPEVIRGLLNGRTIDQLLAANQGNQANPGNQKTVGQVVSSIPAVKIVSPAPFTVAEPNEETEIRALVDFQGAERAGYQVTAAVNGVRIGPPQQEREDGREWEFSWSWRLVDSLNQIEVMVTEPSGAVSSLYSSDIFFARGVNSSDDKYLLHILSIAAKDYEAPADLGGRGGFAKLEFPIDDVVAVTNALTESFEEERSFYRMGLSKRLTEKEITQASVEKAIDEINSSIRSTTDGTQHLLLVNISGHGKSVDGQFYFLPPTIGVNDQDLIKKRGIPWTTFAKAGEVKCRVVFLIDACESGVVVDFKSEVRDPRRSQAIVLAATKGETIAREYGELKHGLFTFSVLEGLAGTADETEKSSVANADGKVDIFELGKYSQDRTLSLSSGSQIPSLAPKRLADTVYLPLIEK